MKSEVKDTWEFAGCLVAFLYFRIIMCELHLTIVGGHISLYIYIESESTRESDGGGLLSLAGFELKVGWNMSNFIK